MIGPILTLGLGSFGSTSLVVTLGYGSGEIIEPVGMKLHGRVYVTPALDGEAGATPSLEGIASSAPVLKGTASITC